MSDTIVRIRSALNGWSLDIQHGEEQSKRYVFSYDDAPGGEQEVKSFAALLSALDNLIGPSTTRYSKHRVYINVRPGDKNEHSLNKKPSKVGIDHDGTFFCKDCGKTGFQSISAARGHFSVCEGGKKPTNKL